MPFVSRLVKLKIYPRPHETFLNLALSAESATVNYKTIIPHLMHDEGLGAPDAYKANPEHASFALYKGPNVYPDSRIDKLFAQIKFSLTKGALETDKIHAMMVGFMPIRMSFLSNYTAKDEKSTNAVEDILKLQTESTDRQGYPLFNGVNMVAKFGTSNLVGADVPGLSVDAQIEGVAFGITEFYRSIRYYTTAGIMKSSVRGLKWLMLTRQKPVQTIRIKIDSKVKRSNEYTFFGTLVVLPQVGTTEQIPVAGDTTAIPHVNVDYVDNFNEWHQGFDMEKV